MDANSFSRRHVLKLLGGAGLVAAVPILGSARSAEAGIAWCRRDPVIRLRTPWGQGNTAAIYMSAALEDYELNDSSCDFVIEHPKDAKTAKIWEDPDGYFGQGASTNFKIGSDLRFGESAMDVRIRCYVPTARRDVPILLEWAPGPIQFDANGDPYPAQVVASATGVGNQWIVLRSTLPYA